MKLYGIRLKLGEVVMDLKEIQRESVKLREQWLEEMAIKNEIADGDTDSQKILKTMLRKIHTQAIDDKLKSITNGEKVGLDYIEIPKGEWFVSKLSAEFFHYQSGVFESYPPKKDKQNKYSKYHVIKIILDDVIQVEVEIL